MGWLLRVGFTLQPCFRVFLNELFYDCGGGSGWGRCRDGCRCVGKGSGMVAKGRFSLATMLLRVDFS